MKTLAEAIPEILRRLPDVTFRVFGYDIRWPDGALGAKSSKESLRSSDICGERVQICGPVSRNLLLDEVEKAAVVVVPSLFETFGLSVTEAMARGTPVIASDIPTFKEIIRTEKEGLLFRTGDAKDMSIRVLQVLTDNQTWQSLSEGSIMRSRDFRVEAIVDQLLTAWGLPSPSHSSPMPRSRETDQMLSTSLLERPENFQKMCARRGEVTEVESTWPAGSRGAGGTSAATSTNSSTTPFPTG